MPARICSREHVIRRVRAGNRSQLGCRGAQQFPRRIVECEGKYRLFGYSVGSYGRSEQLREALAHSASRNFVCSTGNIAPRGDCALRLDGSDSAANAKWSSATGSMTTTSPAALRPGLPTASPLRRRLHPPLSAPMKGNCMNQSGLVRRWCPNADRQRSAASLSAWPHFRCRVKNRAASSPANCGTPVCPPMLACSVFS